MSKPTISEQIEALQKENETYKEMDKAINKLLKSLFGLDRKAIEKLVSEQESRDRKTQGIN